MSGGTQWSLAVAKSPKSGCRIVLLWPEEDPGSDRITNQLMFVLPSPSEGETSGQRLKMILFYYGLGSWFPLKPGRDMFRDVPCPVDTCIITFDQKQTADADAIVYHHRFAQPRHPRPPRQVRILHLLYWRCGDWSKMLKLRHRNSPVVLGFLCCRTNMVVLDQMLLCRNTKPSKSCIHLSLCITIPQRLRLHFLGSRHAFCRHRAYKASETKISSMFPSFTLTAQLIKVLLSKHYSP